jgi:hypothetical protein
MALNAQKYPQSSHATTAANTTRCEGGAAPHVHWPLHAVPPVHHRIRCCPHGRHDAARLRAGDGEHE